MSSIRSVALVGASGNVGKAVLPALLKANLKVSIITRPDSKSTFPSSINVIKTPYDLASLTDAFKGHDAVVAALAAQGLEIEPTLIDAAAAAGVKWFIPSEYGHDTMDQKVVDRLPLLKTKVAVIDHLRSKEKQGLSWTAVETGLFFDWGLEYSFLGFNIKERKATLWDQGTTPASLVNVNAIGTAIATLFTSPSAQDAARNTHVYISSVHTTQVEVLAALEKVTGQKWPVEHVAMKDIIAKAGAAVANGTATSADLFGLIQSVAFAEGGWSDFREKNGKWNKLLGLDEEPETVEETVARVVKKLQG